MPFDASRYPDAVTIGWLVTERMGMGLPWGLDVVLDRELLAGVVGGPARGVIHHDAGNEEES